MIRASIIQEILATAWGKLLALLTITTLAGGLVTEAVAIWNGTSEARIAHFTADYTDAKQKADANVAAFTAAIAAQKAFNGQLREKAKADEANYAAELQHQIARNAEIRKQAESNLKRAEADLNQATSVYAQRQATAEVAKIEAQLADKTVDRDRLKRDVEKCYRPCTKQSSQQYAECLTHCAMGIYGSDWSH